MKKRLEECRAFSTAAETDNDRYKRLLGIDEEELRGEIDLLESQVGPAVLQLRGGEKKKKEDSPASKIKAIGLNKLSEEEVKHREEMLSMLVLKESSVNRGANPGRRKFFDGSQLEKAVKTFDDNNVKKNHGKPSAASTLTKSSTDLFVFRKAPKPSPNP